jgi:hypothetical protein
MPLVGDEPLQQENPNHGLVDLLGPHGSRKHQVFASADDASLGLLQGMERESFDLDISTVDHTSKDAFPQTTLHRSHRTPFIHSTGRISFKHIIVSSPSFHFVN